MKASPQIHSLDPSSLDRSDRRFKTPPRASAHAPLAVPLAPTTALEVGETVAYEFVSADRQWRWALGTVIEVHGPLNSRAATRTSHGTVVFSSKVNGALDPAAYMLVTVRDWALSEKTGGRPKRILAHRPEPLPSPSAMTTPGAGEKLNPIPPPVPAIAPAATAARDVTSDAATAQVLVQLSWEAVSQCAPCDWEALLRLAPEAVPAVLRLSLTALFAYAGLMKPQAIPAQRELDPAAAAASWASAMSVLESPGMGEKLHAFFLETMSGARPAAAARADLAAIHERLRRSVLSHPQFHCGHAFAAETLPSRLFRCVESIEHYCDAAQQQQQQQQAGRAAAGQLRPEPADATSCRSRSRSRCGASGFGPAEVLFVKGSSHTTMVRGSVLCKVRAGPGGDDDSIVIGEADLEAISSITFAARSGAQSGDQATSAAHTPTVRASMLEDSLPSVPLPYASSPDGESRSPPRSAPDALCDYYEGKVHAYAVDLEKARYQLRQQQLNQLRVADMLQTTLFDILESRLGAEESLDFLVASVEDGIDELAGCEVEPPPPTGTPLPGDLRADLQKYFQLPSRGTSPGKDNETLGLESEEHRFILPEYDAAPALTAEAEGTDMEASLVSSLHPDSDAAEGEPPIGRPPLHAHAVPLCAALSESAVADACPAEALDGASPLSAAKQAWPDRVQQHRNSNVRFDELQRQEVDIVRLTSLLAVETEHHVAAQLRVERLQRMMTDMLATLPTKTTVATPAQAAPASASALKTTREVNARYLSLRRRAREAVLRYDSEAADARKQIVALEQTSNMCHPGAVGEAREYNGRRASVLQTKMEVAEARRQEHLATHEELVALHKAVLTLVRAS